MGRLVFRADGNDPWASVLCSPVMARKWIWPAILGSSIAFAAASFLLPVPISTVLCGLLECEGLFTGSEFHSATHCLGFTSAYFETVLLAASPIVLALVALAHLRKPSRTVTIIGALVAGAVAFSILFRHQSVYHHSVSAIITVSATYALMVLVSVRWRLPLLGLIFLVTPVALAFPPYGLHLLGPDSGAAYWCQVGSVVLLYAFGGYILHQSQEAAKLSRKPACLPEPSGPGEHAVAGNGA